jgi:meiotically up-regulated gene 157 (Mug157) protein
MRSAARILKNDSPGYNPSTALPAPRRGIIIAMLLASSLVYLLLWPLAAASRTSSFNPADPKAAYRREACPDYKDYSARRHPPYTTGRYQLPFQRPAAECRLFKSDAVEAKIASMTAQIADVDLARLFENCFPNTLDTTVRWHKTSDDPTEIQSFIVTGDINAQWLRDSTNQLKQYQSLAKDDPALQKLLLGAINTQADFVLESPYCNAFQPPKASGLDPSSNGQDDSVHPTYDPDVVFECKYEIDSLASFLSLADQYYASTGDASFITPKWLSAVQTVLDVIEEQSVGTFSASGEPNDMTYTFQRQTNIGTETLSLNGIGNPLACNTSLVRSAFRPSDDACILQFFIPGNAFLSVELGRAAALLRKTKKAPELAKTLQKKSDEICAAVWKYGTTTHPVWGKVFAYEVDGYGSTILMDDANLPSLLALPLLGFVDRNDPTYQNTRKMVLAREGNPFYLVGSQFRGVGGPHIGITHAWPLSLLVQAMTSDDDDEIVNAVEMVLKVSAKEGLIHESVNVERSADYTRPWFAWANSVFAQTILDLVERKPELLIGKSARINGGKAKANE